MSYTITHNCIGCQRCLSACPTGAIQTNGVAFWIEIDRCNQCQDSHGVPQCWATCPTNEGCVPLTTAAAAVSLTSQSETSGDYWESWFATYTRLVARLQSMPESGYWHQWFEAYSQVLRRSQATTV
ncbi:MAG: 4Fe-4S binding protein [Leptolyngbyaceae cyanobacterium SM2_5_2]|nr:4Fe-4S binding protein [Leptolyngbyaceae cyanobacterium SM2_5_2]